MRSPQLRKNVSTTSSQTITVLSSSEENSFEHNIIRKHLRALTKGTSSRYQRQVTLVNCLIWVQITFVSMIGAFVFMNPVFKCKGVEASESMACMKIGKCKVLNNFTATFTHNLYCSGQGDRIMIQSMFPAGCLIGMFMLPWVSDKHGRRFALLLGLGFELFGISVLLIGLERQSLLGICVGQLLLGIFASGCSVLSYVISSQISTGRLRQSSIMLFNGVWGLCLMSFYFIHSYMPEWHNFLVYLILLPALGTAIVAYFTVMETPDYLLIIQGALEDYVAMMKRMAIINRARPKKYQKVFGKRGKYNIFTIFEYQPAAIKTYSSNKKLKSHHHINHHHKHNEEAPFAQIKTPQAKKMKPNTFSVILKDPNTLKMIFCVGLSMIGYNIFYFGMQGSMEKSKNSYGVSMLIAGAHEFIGFLLSGIFIPKIKRKSGLIIANSLAALGGLCFMLPLVDSSRIMQTLILSFATLMTVFSYSLSSTLQTESYPSTVKSTAIGITSGFAQMGRIAVPFLLNLTNKLQLHPLFSSSIFFLILGTLPLFFVKETLENDDQEQEEEEQFNNEQEENVNAVGDKELLSQVSLNRSASVEKQMTRMKKQLSAFEKSTKNEDKQD